MRAQVIARLNLQTGSSALSFTSSQIDQEIRDAFIYHFGILRPIIHATETLDSSLASGAIDDMAVAQYVEVNRIMLFRNEWVESDNTIEVVVGDYARSGNGINVWYTKDDNLAASPTTIDSDCIHGSDWLEPVSLLKAEIESLMRLSRTSDTGNATFQIQSARTLEQRYNQMVAEMRRTRDMDVATLEQRLIDRVRFGPAPYMPSPLSGFEHEGQIYNWTTGIP